MASRHGYSLVPAALSTTVPGGVRCDACILHCTIPDGGVGRCRARANANGRLFSLVHGVVGSLSVNPIEKKPVCHYLPGSEWFSVGTFGCNFLCPGCQNWELAHADPRNVAGTATVLPPEELVENAVRSGCVGVSWTFNEPAVWFEYVLAGARIARDRGLHTNVVTNGSFSVRALDLLAPYLNVYRVDIKGFSDRVYRRLTGQACLSGVLRGTRRVRRRWGLHVEVVTNVIPSVSDDPDELLGLAHWIRDELGEAAPWHLTRFQPAHKLTYLPPTPVSLLERAREAAMEAGLRFVYLGNVPGHAAESTWCPACGELLIQREGVGVSTCSLADGRCPACGGMVPGVFAAQPETVR